MDAAHAAGPGGHAAAQAASDDHARARTELTGAQDDERRAAGRQRDAEHDLRIAQRHGKDANTHAQDAAKRAEAAFHAAAHELDVTISPISPPVPIDAAPPAGPDLLASLAAGGGKPRSVFTDPLFPSYTPAEARSQQIQADEQRHRDAAPKHGSYFDALGGEIKGLTGIRPFGDKNTQVYRTAEKITNIAGYLPTPAAVERIGARLAIKEGEHLLEHQAERGAANDVGQGLPHLAKRRLAKSLGRVPRSSSPVAQGGSSATGRWWEYVDSEGNPKIVVEHSDGTVHVGSPKPQSTHREGGPPKFYDHGPFGHVGE